MTRPDFPFVKQYSVSAFLFFLFGSDSFSVGFVQFEITFIRCLNCNYIKIDEKESHSHIQNRFLFFKKKEEKESIVKCKLSFKRNAKLLAFSVYLCVLDVCARVFVSASAHNGKLFHI